jgi:hypothetical protein
MASMKVGIDREEMCCDMCDRNMTPEERHAIFVELCKDVDYPCGKCTTRKDVERCVATDGCAAWSRWFSKTWREICEVLKHL